MGVKIKTSKNDFYKIEQAAKKLNGKKVMVGVLGGGENAWLASIHEYGCKIRITPKMRAWLHFNGLHVKDSTTTITIPERSFLRNGYDECSQKVIDSAEKLESAALGGKITIEQYLEAVGLSLSSKIKTYARDLETPPNHPFTIQRKGSSNPLVSTGNMIESITYKVE